MAPLISLCMIAKDEEDEIALALDSARHLVDELVVYDTGSSDATVEIAGSFGAVVVEGYWDDDFGRARNAALAHCRGEWALWLDADETVHGDAETFRRGLAAAPPELLGYSLPIELLEGNGLAGRSVFQTVRLFRRAACRFEGRLHEQVVRADGGGPPAAASAAGLRLLHRGYTTGYFVDGAKVQRNLRLAELALEDPGSERGMALFNYARTLMMGDDVRRALAPLEEALALPDDQLNERVRRYALATLASLQLHLGDNDAALAVVERLRAMSQRRATADMLEARIHLAAGDHRRCLEAADRVSFLDVDDDGNEVGRHQVASLRARALMGLDRPGDAADALLDSLSSQGVLDEPLDVLVGLLLVAGRELAEVATALRPETVAVFSSAAGGLAPAQADIVLTAVRERFPERLEPLAVGATVAARLPVARALWWSAELRRAGLSEQCPLVAIARNTELEPVVRLRAAAAAFASFSEQRAVEPAQQVVATLAGDERAGAIADVAALSPPLAVLLTPDLPTCAALLSLDGRARDGFLALTTRPDSAVATAVTADSLPLRGGGAHLLAVHDVLASLPRPEVGFALDEWLRVLAPGGELVVEVPDLEAAARRLLATVVEPAASVPSGPGEARREARREDRREAERDAEHAARDDALRLLYGPGRFGDAGRSERYRTGFTAASLVELVSGHGFAVESAESQPGGATLTVRARAPRIVGRLAAASEPEVSVVVVTEHGAEALRACMTSIAASDAGATYEVVCVDSSGDPAVLAFLSSLAGAATVLTSPAPLAPTAALNLAARTATGRDLVLLREAVEVSDGWAAGLAGALADGTSSLVSASIVGSDGAPRGGALRLLGDASAPVIETRPARGGKPAALGAGCVALRRSTWQQLRGLAGGLDLDDAVVDLSLRARDLGELRSLPELTLHEHGRDRAVATPFGPGTVHVTASRRELAHRWAARVPLEAPNVARPTLASLLPSTTLLDRIEHADELQIGPPRPGGCNLVGDFSATGPDAGRVRAWSLAQHAASLPASRLAFSAGPLQALDDEPLAFDTTLLCLAGEDLVEYVARAGLESLRGRYTILDWHWPFAGAVEEVAGTAAMVSEIWTPSSFTQRALRELTTRPVRLQSPPVVPAAASLSRGDLGMPAGFVVASLAEIGRGRAGEVALANPLGAVEAFCAAFPPGSGPSLYLALCGSRTEATADRCREAAGGRNDVVVVEQLPEGGADSVVALADCYVSLHRSSAFAMAVARAVARGVPVVVSRVGGPLEYLDESVADLVEVVPAATTAAHAPYPAGLTWGDPDLEDAAAALYNVADEPDAARARAHGGASRIGRTHNLELASRTLKRRLAAVAPLQPQVARAHRARRRAHR